MLARTLLRGKSSLSFSPSRKILLYSLFLSDVSLENRPYRFFLRGSNDYDVNVCITMCNIGLQSY